MKTALRRKATYVLIIVGLVFIVFSLMNNTLGQQLTETNEVKVHIDVQVLDVNPSQKTANVNIMVRVNSFPDNITNFTLLVGGGGESFITCNNVAQDYRGWFFQGQSNETSWFLEGSGETYPFDSYNMRFMIMDSYIPGSSHNVSINSVDSQAYFSGPRTMFLNDLWTQNNSLIPTTWDKGWITQNQTTTEMDLSIKRTGNSFNIAFLEFMLPIIACYYLLVATLLLNPKKHLNERLTIYLAILVFVPTFFIAIQNYLPYRSSLSLPELLLTNLVIGTVIFGVFSIFGKHGWGAISNTRFKNLTLHHNGWDLVGIGICLSLFLLIYYFTLFGKIAPEASFLVSYLIIPSYLIWYPFENIKTISLRLSNKSILAFLMVTVILASCFIAIFYFPNLLLFEAFFIGILGGMYLGKVAKSGAIGFIGGIFSTIFTGIFVGLSFPQAGTSGFTAIFEGITATALFGYPIGFYAGAGGILGAIFFQLISERKNRSNEQKRDFEPNDFAL